eukprot:Sdes_comp20266_c0_seq1m13793
MAASLLVTTSAGESAPVLTIAERCEPTQMGNMASTSIAAYADIFNTSSGSPFGKIKLISLIFKYILESIFPPLVCSYFQSLQKYGFLFRKKKRKDGEYF